jgi:hypothetical protein
MDVSNKHHVPVVIIPSIHKLRTQFQNHSFTRQNDDCVFIWALLVHVVSFSQADIECDLARMNYE